MVNKIEEFSMLFVASFLGAMMSIVLEGALKEPTWIQSYTIVWLLACSGILYIAFNWTNLFGVKLRLIDWKKISPNKKRFLLAILIIILIIVVFSPVVNIFY